MHTESLDVHEEALILFNTPGLENNYQFELEHKAIIENLEDILKGTRYLKESRLQKR